VLQVVPAGEVEVLHHLMPIKDGRWSWGYVVEWKRSKEPLHEVSM
jgi:hypothetical protein